MVTAINVLSKNKTRYVQPGNCILFSLLQFTALHERHQCMTQSCDIRTNACSTIIDHLTCIASISFLIIAYNSKQVDNEQTKGRSQKICNLHLVLCTNNLKNMINQLI